MTVSDKSHGLDWGWYRRVGTGWRLKHVDVGGDFVRLNSIKEIETDQFVFKFGNDFGSGWIDHKTIPHKNWRFWDNPEIPHFLYPNPVNPQGLKSWIRWTPGDILTTHKHQRGAERVNTVIREITGKNLTWHDVVKPKTVSRRNSKTVLLCPSSPNCYTYYYNTNWNDWVGAWTTRLEKLGYTTVVRSKPSRTLRNRSEQFQLKHQLDELNALCTISQHSASAMETILAGYPTVITGPHPAGDLATPWEEFKQGELRIPHTSEVEDWCDWLLGNTRHKSELWDGAWQEIN